VLPAETGPEVIVRAYRELTTLARLTWNPYLYDPKLQRRLGRIDRPTLVVWGENDRILPPAHGEEFAALIPNAILEVLPECGHLVPLERADAFSRLAVDFLTS
jgi:pimeloyl-ACP methyl ester carboxylesterase